MFPTCKWNGWRKPQDEPEKQVCNIDTRRSYSSTTTSAQKYYSIVYLDNAANKFGIGGDAWIIEEVSDKTVTVEGYDSDDSTKDNIPIVTGVSAVDFPDNKTIIIVSKYSTIMGESANTLCSEKKME